MKKIKAAKSVDEILTQLSDGLVDAHSLQEALEQHSKYLAMQINGILYPGSGGYIVCSAKEAREVIKYAYYRRLP